MTTASAASAHRILPSRNQGGDEEETETERILAERARYVARGVSPSPLVVARAEGARICDVDGRAYIDFAGGIGCQNTGDGFAPAVAAIHEQADRFLHQCFIVGTYEPYIEVCRRLAELSPCGTGEQRSILVNSGAEAIENAVKIARAVTGRPAVSSSRTPSTAGRSYDDDDVEARLQEGLRAVRA